MGAGTTFEVFFPAAGLPPEPEITAITSCPPGNDRILLVDDEPAITDMAKQWLTRLGYRVVAVNSSLEARTLFRDDPEGFDLLVTDQTMPHLPGSELAKEGAGNPAWVADSPMHRLIAPS